MRIQQAEIKDAEEILVLQKLAYQSEVELYGVYDIDPMTQTVEGMKIDIEKQIVLKAIIEDKIIGSVRAFEKNNTCFIGRLIVDPNYQNKGIGKKLMEEIEKKFNKVNRYELFTGHKSVKNIKLYKKLGYNVFKQEKVNEKLTLVRLEKTKE